MTSNLSNSKISRTELSDSASFAYHTELGVTILTWPEQCFSAALREVSPLYKSGKLPNGTWERWGTKFSGKRGTIVMRDWPAPEAGKTELLTRGATLTHELEHAKGGNEVAARLAEREYLRNQGLKGPSDEQILGRIAKYYWIFHTLPAARVLFPNLSWIGRIVHCVKSIKLADEYSVSRDLQEAKTQSV